MSVAPGQTLLHYRLLDKIGAGGMGVGPRWAVSADGQRFVINAARDTRGAGFSVVLNWPATLARN